MIFSNNGSEQYRRYYSGNYEKYTNTLTGVTRQLHYVGGNVLVVKNSTTPAVDSIYYIQTDHLGSIVMITKDNKSVVQERSYDAWGRPRDAATWAYNTTSAAFKVLDRGYTGHEHIFMANEGGYGGGLINMNGRIFDPLLGRMLSPDIYVQSPNFTQSFNHYSYCTNNPLKYIDPSGWRQGHFRGSTLADFRGLDGGADGGDGAASSGAAWASNDVTYNWVTGFYEVNGQPVSTAYAMNLVSSMYFSGSGKNIPEGTTGMDKLGYFKGNVTGLIYHTDNDVVGYGGVKVSKELDLAASGLGPDWMEKTTTGLEAFGLAYGIKEGVIEGGAALNRGIRIYHINNISVLRTYGASVAQYLKISKALGVVGSVVTTGYSAGQTINQFNSGGMNEVFNNRDVLDATVGMTGLGFAAYGIFVASNPIGWGVGAAVLLYGGATMIWDASHPKK